MLAQFTTIRIAYLVIAFGVPIDKAEWKHSRLVKGNVEEEIRSLKQRERQDLVTYGSADLTSTLTRPGLIDEYQLVVDPVLVGW